MRNKLFFIICVIILGFNIGFSQEKIEQVEESEWSYMVSYIAAKITNLYIQESIRKKRSEPRDSIEYLKFKEELANNSLNQPINPETLQEYLRPQFNVTNAKLTSRILAWKNLEIKDQNILFDSLLNLLEERRSDIQTGPEYNALKAEIIPGSDNTFEEAKQEFGTIPKEKNSDNFERAGLWNNIFLFRFLTGIFLLTTFFFIIIWQHNKKRARTFEGNIKELEKDINDLEKKINNSSTSNSNNIRTQSYYSERKTKKTEKESLEGKDIKKEGASTKSNITQSKEPFQKKPEQKNYTPSPPPEIKSEPEVLYAGKPSPQGEFQELKINKEENHIYKLTLLDDITAEFELVDLNNYMKTEVVNSPDDYLYRVCHHENDNIDFTNNILTIQKGTANKLDENWQVNEDNKAIIKFQ